GHRDREPEPRPPLAPLRLAGLFSERRFRWIRRGWHPTVPPWPDGPAHLSADFYDPPASFPDQTERSIWAWPVQFQPEPRPALDLRSDVNVPARCRPIET